MTTEMRGAALLRDPELSRLTSFSRAEREALGLEGLLPAAVESARTRIGRAREQLGRKQSDLEKYDYLRTLQDLDEALFYGLVRSDCARFLPLVYTPTVGDACLAYSRMFERPRGMFISLQHRGRIRQVLRNWPHRDVRFIVVTSGGRILGLGDLGANGMGIPIGKLTLYTVAAGVPPNLTLPIMLDCGTDNQDLLDDPLYIGLRRARPPAAELDEFVAEFAAAVQEEFPGCCIQFEDWARADALRLLARYRETICCFNDDIQGSGAVALAGLLSAARITGSSLGAQTILFLGSGSAGVGIAELLVQAMKSEGLSIGAARERIWMYNTGGLVESSRTDLPEYLRVYAHRHPAVASFSAAVESIRPTAIIGVSTAAGAFDRAVIEAMARLNPRPVILALSNPTSRAECTARQAYEWSGGRAVFAGGSPFAPVEIAGRTIVPGQCNNLYVFPAMGLALYATRATRVTNQMFLAAARAVANLVTTSDLERGLIYPPLENLQETEAKVAEAIAEEIFALSLAQVNRPRDLAQFIRARIYRPAGGADG
jgi:malate dehydrogenase (oxaloacetate-decarboxylating)(NADP+)